MAGKKKMWKTGWIFICFIFFVVQMVPVTAEKDPVFENDRFLMTVDTEDLTIVITDKASGQKIYSAKSDEGSNGTWQGYMHSAVALDLYTGQSMEPVKTDMINGNPDIVLNLQDMGFEAKLTFEEYDFSMTLVVSLTEEGLKVGVPADSIKESEDFKLGAITLYPFLGATAIGEHEGYLFIPESAGALIDLKDNLNQYKTPYEKKVYGLNPGISTDRQNSTPWWQPEIKNSKSISDPVFGMTYEDTSLGLYGIITKGADNAKIQAYPNGVVTPFNFINTKFLYREIYTKQTARESGAPTIEDQGHFRDVEVTYHILGGQESGYSAFAKVYRDYLIEEGYLVKTEDQFEPKFTFFGADTKKWFIFNDLVPVTTLDQMEEILNQLEEGGIHDYVPVYKAWQKDGAYLSLGDTGLKIDGQLGSTKDLKKLGESLAADGNDLILEIDLLRASTQSFYNTRKDLIKGINEILVKENTHGRLFGETYVQSPNLAGDIADKYVKRYGDTSLNHVAIEGLPETLYSYFLSGDIFGRDQALEQIDEVFAGMEDLSRSLYKPNNYLYQYMDQYFDMELSTSNYSYISQEVPFLPMVLKSYVPYWAGDVNFVANQREYFLKMIEYGAYPSFLLTGESPIKLRDTESSHIYTSEFSVLKDKIFTYTEELGQVFKPLEGVAMVDHQVMDNNLVKVTYEDGTILVINYGQKDLSVDINDETLTVKALDYKVIGGEGQ